MKRMRYYSQNGEDFLLWEFFRRKKSGFYMEIGAFDGIHLSNSYIFEKTGWKGICIEAHPDYYQKCKKNRPGSMCIHAACVGDETIDEVAFHSEEMGLLSGIKMRDDIKQRYEGRNLKFKGFNLVNVPASTLDGILETFAPPPEIDFVSIDVEGHEMEVLKGFDIDKYKPRVLVVEANTEPDELELDNYLVKKIGYFKARRLFENVFYCLNKSDADNLGKTEITCNVEVSPHPLGREYDLPVNKKVHCGFLSIIRNKLSRFIG